MSENNTSDVGAQSNTETLWRLNSEVLQRMQINSPQDVRHILPRGITPQMLAQHQHSHHHLHHHHHAQRPATHNVSTAPQGLADGNVEPSFVLDMGSALDSANSGGINIPGFSSDHFQLLSQNHDENQNTGPIDQDGGGIPGARNIDWKMCLMNSLLFIIILLVRLLSDHILGLLVFLGLGGTFFYANMFFKKLVHESSLRDALLHKILLSYFWIMVYLTANIACVYYVFKDQELWNVLIFRWPNKWKIDIWTFFWVIVVNDFVLKFVTVIIKALLSMAPMKPKHRGKYYMFTEHMMQMYRMLVTFIPWYHFLSDDLSWVFSAFLLCFYFLCKGYQMFSKGLAIKNAFFKLLNEKSYGEKPSHADLKSRGENCPICHEEFQDPVMLNCKHIFCEDCVSVWFDREKTCPMCRAQIHTDSSAWKDGSTSVHIQWY